MTTLQTNIDGYTVDLETGIDDSDGSSPTQCWISKDVKGRYHSASLETLINTEELSCSSSGLRDDYIHKVKSETISKVEEWSLAHGY